MEMVFHDEDRAAVFEAKVRKLLEGDDMQVLCEEDVRTMLATMTPGDQPQVEKGD
jgi:hypothetical protein